MNPLPDNPLEEACASQLAQANLHRMRKQWEYANAVCLQVLYDAPDNWRAHALLGDIAAERGLDEEAIQWYCMALEIRPDAQATRDRLSEIVNDRRSELNKTLSTRLQRGSAPARPPSGGINQLLAANGARPLMLACGVAATILLGIAAMAVPLRSSQSIRQVVAPVFSPNLLGGSGSSAAQQTNGGASPAPSPVFTLQTAQTPSQLVSRPAADTALAADPSLVDADEARLMSSLQQDPSLRALGVIIGTCVIDPSSSAAIVTISSPTAGSVNPQQEILSCAAATARSVLLQAGLPSLRQCSIRFLATVGSAPEIVFIGIVARSAVADNPAGSPPSGDSSQAAALFSSLWWAPAFAPARSTPAQPQPASAATPPNTTLAAPAAAPQSHPAASQPGTV